MYSLNYHSTVPSYNTFDKLHVLEILHTLKLRLQTKHYIITDIYPCHTSGLTVITLGTKITHFNNGAAGQQVNNVRSTDITTVCVKKINLHKTFCNVFIQAKYISMKFCQFVASLHPHIFTNFGRFTCILIYNKKQKGVNIS